MFNNIHKFISFTKCSTRGNYLTCTNLTAYYMSISKLIDIYISFRSIVFSLFYLNVSYHFNINVPSPISNYICIESLHHFTLHVYFLIILKSHHKKHISCLWGGVLQNYYYQPPLLLFTKIHSNTYKQTRWKHWY